MEHRLIAISAPGFFEGEAEILNGLFAAGLARLHIRKPGSKKKEVAALLNEIDPAFRKLISLHYHPQLADEMCLGGVHVTYTQFLKQPHSSGFDRTVSCSIHQWEEYQTLQTKVDYCFISPVFHSISKPDYYANRALHHPPSLTTNIYALGGITAHNFQVLLDMGYSGIAVMGYLWEDKNFAEMRFDFLKRQLQAYGN